MSRPYPSDMAEPLNVRMPPGMRQLFKDLAKANNRSMNAEIISALERHLASSGVELPAQPKPYSARLDVFVAAAMSGIIARGSDSVDLAEAISIGRKMLELMEKDGADATAG